MVKCLMVFTFAIVLVSGQTWVSRAHLNSYGEFWHNLMQELVNELERREWCNMKLVDITQTIDDNLFNMHVTGEVRYTNGFVISIQKIEVIDVQSSVSSRTIDDEVVPFGTIRGKLNFRDMLVGHDFYANLTSPEGEYRSTGTFLHTLVQMQLDIAQNLITKEMTSSSFVNSVSAGSGVRMHYMPSSNITEALGRRFSSSTFTSAGNWGSEIFAPIMLDIATNKLKFPTICFNNCS